MSEASVVAIYLHGEQAAPMRTVEEVCAEIGGLAGDRYNQNGEAPPRAGLDREVSLIEEEALRGLREETGIALDASESRRNLVTRGVALNPLVDREFRIGAVRLKGLRLCHPCKHLESLTQLGVYQGLQQKGGLRAQVLEGGTIRVGDRISAEEAG